MSLKQVLKSDNITSRNSHPHLTTSLVFYTPTSLPLLINQLFSHQIWKNIRNYQITRLIRISAVIPLLTNIYVHVLRIVVFRV